MRPVGIEPTTSGSGGQSSAPLGASRLPEPALEPNHSRGSPGVPRLAIARDIAPGGKGPDEPPRPAGTPLRGWGGYFCRSPQGRDVRRFARGCPTRADRRVTRTEGWKHAAVRSRATPQFATVRVEYAPTFGWHVDGKATAVKTFSREGNPCDSDSSFRCSRSRSLACR